MKLFSIDIETSALDPKKGQVLEFAAILEDTENPTSFEDAEKFHRILKWGKIEGEAYALQMNDRLLRIIAGIDPLPEGCQFADNEAYFCTPLEATLIEFDSWVQSLDMLCPVNAIGASLCAFDVPFLENKMYKWRELFFRRILEIESMFAEPSDEKAPGLKQCLERAGMEMTQEHAGMADAWDTIRALRWKWGY